MSRQEKLRKLANAIREYRGRTSSPAGAEKVQWEQTPRPHKLKRIRELLGLLRFDGEEQEYAISQIDGFKTLNEFDVWLKVVRGNA